MKRARRSRGLFLALMLLGCSRTDLASSGSSEPVSSGGGGSIRPDPCDADGDGHKATSCGGGDCNDADASIHPGALDANVGAGPWIIQQASAGVDGDLRATPSIAVDKRAAAHLS